MNVSVAILAGGLGIRLRPYTDETPKCLVEVAGRPFAEHQIELLRRQGVGDIVFLVGHFGEMVRDTLGDGSRWGLRLRYLFDGPKPLGTGGAIRRALPELGDPFFVLYGDSYLDCDYAQIAATFMERGKAGLMTVYRNRDRWDRSNVFYKDGRIVRYDKTHLIPEMQHVDYGLAMLSRAAFSTRAIGEAFDLATLYSDLLGEDQLAAYEVTTRFYEIGSISGLNETRLYLATKGTSDRGLSIPNRCDKPTGGRRTQPPHRRRRRATS